jgi:hypothetical protein
MFHRPRKRVDCGATYTAHQKRNRTATAIDSWIKSMGAESTEYLIIAYI